jgi:1,4-dihydroxy-2-naphthoate octaprenyltransferase
MAPFETIIALIYIWYRKIEGDTSEKINWFALLLGFFILAIFISLNIQTFLKGSFPLLLLFTTIALGFFRLVFHKHIDIEEITTIKNVKRTNLIVTLSYCLISMVAYLFRFNIQDFLRL